MKYVKKLELYEMAKDWPVGSIVKCTDINDLSKTTSTYSDKWVSWKPTGYLPSGESSFYMKITESGRTWLVGSFLYSNGIMQSKVEAWGKFRFRTKYAAKPSDDLKIIEDNKAEINKYLGTSFFVSEDAIIMSNSGEKANIKEGEYLADSLNFKLTELYGEPVFILFSKTNSYNNFSIKMSDLNSLGKEFSQEQREVVAEWLAKQTGANVSVKRSNYVIQNYYVKSKSGEFPSSFSAGPFISKKQADEYAEYLKKEKITLFNPLALKTETGNSYSDEVMMTTEELIKFCNTLGIKTSLKDLLNLRRGAVTGKKFGL